MNKKYLNILLIVSLIITLIGLVTGKFFFLFLILPFGFGLFRSRSKNDDDSNNPKRLNQ